jgi:hypothetical protein
MHGTADKLTAPYGSFALVWSLPRHANAIAMTWNGYAHDLLHEPNGGGAKVEDAMVAWLENRLTNAPLLIPAAVSEHSELHGRPRGWTQAIEGALGVAFGDQTRLGGELSVQLARPAPVGWYGALTAERDANGYAIALRPLGIAVRPHGLMGGISIGAALVGRSQRVVNGTPIDADRRFAFDIGAGLEMPAGPLHLGLHYDLQGLRTINTFVSLRFGGDRRYWPFARAGVGPMVTAGVVCDPDLCDVMALAGFQLYGAD